MSPKQKNFYLSAIAVLFSGLTASSLWAQSPAAPKGGPPSNSGLYSVPPPAHPVPILPALPAPDDTSFYAKREVPHGKVEIFHYKTSVGAEKQLHVYLPPGYDASGDVRYPVLYLNHGGGENDSQWTATNPKSGGFANLILDSLIAAGKARPMIIVMPNTGMTHLETFGELYVFSSGYWPDMLTVFKANIAGLLSQPTINERFRMPIYFAAGETDIAYLNNMKTLAVFNGYGIRTFSVLSSNGHEWLNWRRYLYQTAQIMFPEDR